MGGFLILLTPFIMLGLGVLTQGSIVAISVGVLAYFLLIYHISAPRNEGE